MKQKIKLFFLTLCAAFCCTFLAPTVSASLPMPSSGNYDSLIADNLVNRSAGSTVTQVRNRIFNSSNMRLIYIIVGSVAILFICITGAKLIFSGGNEDNISKARGNIIWIIVGLIIVAAAIFFGFQIFDPTKPDILEPGGESMRNFVRLLNGIKVFFQIAVAAVALAVLTVSGFNLIVRGDQDDAQQQEQRFIIAFVTATGLILLAEVLVRIFSNNYFNAGGAAGTITGTQAVQEVIGVLNFVLTFLAGSVVFMLILASLYYVISFGDEERTSSAKKIITACVVALIIIFTLFVLGTFLI